MKVTEIAGYKQVSSRAPIGVRELWKKAQASGKILKSKPFPGSGRFLADGQPSGRPAVVDPRDLVAVRSKTSGRPPVPMVEGFFDKVELRSFKSEPDISQ